jgi:hypothetical protein
VTGLPRGGNPPPTGVDQQSGGERREVDVSVELRAEHRLAEVGHQVLRWHIARTHHLKGLCQRLLDPVADDLPITEAAGITPKLRCGDCWRLYSRAIPATWAGHPH